MMGMPLIWQACETSSSDQSQSSSIQADPPKAPPPKNWIWTSPDKKASDRELTDRYSHLLQMGITGILFGGDDERNYLLAKNAGLETHIWMWTLNRREDFIMEHHPEWYAINRKGESCFDKPPYVDYYRWLCPSRQPVRDYLAEKVQGLLDKPYIDGIHLDYVRYCDVILPKALWEKYDLVQHEELPQFDYCYCEVCRKAFKTKYGLDPLEMDDPPSNLEWLQYRYDTVTDLVNQLSDQVHMAGKMISAAVFPTPGIAKKLVRQEWVNWNLDMIFPMIYQGFYEEDVAWIGTAVKEGVDALDGKYPLYAGLFLPDLPEAEDLKLAKGFSMENGARGVALFGEVSDDHLAMILNPVADFLIL